MRPTTTNRFKVLHKLQQGYKNKGEATAIPLGKCYILCKRANTARLHIKKLKQEQFYSQTPYFSFSTRSAENLPRISVYGYLLGDFRPL